MNVKFTKIVSICSFLSITSFAQTGNWSLQTSGVQDHLLGICAIDDSIAYISGDYGTLLKTVDAGANWTKLISGNTSYLHSIDFYDDKHGIVAGNNGIIIKTVDGGLNWTNLNLTSNALRCVYFYNTQIGFIAGGANGQFGYGEIFKTTDGGNTWNSQTITASNIIYSVKFTSNLVGYCCDYNGEIFKTIDGGTNWILQNSGTTQPLTSIDFYNNNEGVVLGGVNNVRKTTNGGSSWSNITLTTTNNLSALKFIDATDGFIVGGNVANNTGIILNTKDGGTSWTNFLPGTNRLYSVDFYKKNTGYAVGLNGTIIKYGNTVGEFVKTKNVFNINAYPNPTNGSITIDLSNIKDVLSIEVFDMQGKIVYDKLNINNEKLVINKLNSGTYLYQVKRFNEIIKTDKIIFE